MRNIYQKVIISLFLVSFSYAGLLNEFPVKKVKLKNGLTLLVHASNELPLVSVHLWYRVGSQDEKVGQTGLAHLFEHMMFKGSKNFPGDQFDQILQSSGAINNAFTSQDYTGYYEQLPASKLELILKLEADRMVNLIMDQPSYDSERAVVKEERRMRVENTPFGVAYENLMSLLFKGTRYQWTPIGSMDDLNKMTLAQATDFYKKYYGPQNATLVIVGDVDVEKTAAMVEKIFGALPAGVKTERTSEAFQYMGKNTPVVQFVQRQVQSEYILLAYPSAPSGTQDAFALDLLAYIMGKGEASRAYQRLILKEKTVSSVSIENNTMANGGYFQAMVAMKPGLTFQKAESSLRSLFWYPANQKVTVLELEAAKNQMLRETFLELRTIQNKALQLAYHEIVFGDYRKLFQNLDLIQKITPQNVLDASQKYIVKPKSHMIVVRSK